MHDDQVRSKIDGRKVPAIGAYFEHLCGDDFEETKRLLQSYSDGSGGGLDLGKLNSLFVTCEETYGPRRGAIVAWATLMKARS